VAAPRAQTDGRPATGDEARTPLPVLRLRHLLNRARSATRPARRRCRACWPPSGATSTPPRCSPTSASAALSLGSELLARMRLRVLPGTPETDDLAGAVPAALRTRRRRPGSALDDATLRRAGALLGRRGAEAAWRAHAAGGHHHPRQRGARRGLRAGAAPAHGPRAAGRRALPPAHGSNATPAPPRWLDGDQADRCSKPPTCVRCSTLPARRRQRDADHLEQYGVSVTSSSSLDQLRPHAPHRAAARLLLAPAAARTAPPAVRLVRVAQQRGLRALLARHYSLLARQVAERSAETGEHYITRDRAEYRDMLRAPPAAAR
jgi:hypothetical protein